VGWRKVSSAADSLALRSQGLQHFKDSRTKLDANLAIVSGEQQVGYRTSFWLSS